MPLSDKKKCQTLINECAAVVDTLKAAAMRLETLRTAYQNQSVDPTGSPLDGNVLAVSNWIDDVRAAADSVVANELRDHRVPTHSGKALGV